MLEPVNLVFLQKKDYKLIIKIVAGKIFLTSTVEIDTCADLFHIHVLQEDSFLVLILNPSLRNGTTQVWKEIMVQYACHDMET